MRGTNEDERLQISHCTFLCISAQLGQKGLHRSHYHVQLAAINVFLWALPLKGINWQPHATHPLFIGFT